MILILFNKLTNGSWTGPDLQREFNVTENMKTQPASLQNVKSKKCMKQFEN